MIRLAVIGSGLRAAALVKLAQEMDSDVHLAAVADPDGDNAKAHLSGEGVAFEETRFFGSADELIEHSDGFDALMLGTRCDLHTQIAVKVAPLGLPLFLEKPVSITFEQLADLSSAFAGRDQKVVVSFPLRMTPLCQRVNEIVQSGRLGVINQVVAYNDVPYGGVYFGQWYRDHKITGGLWLQKATHDFDYINHLLDATPLAIAATSTRRVYGGSEPAGLHCSTCTKTELCPESPTNILKRGDDGGMGKEDHACAFSSSIENQDAGAAMVMYDDATQLSYTQNFVTRRSAARRGARITGYYATLDFDWFTEKIRVTEHHGQAVDDIHVPVVEGHHGGDSVLIKNFLHVIRGQAASKSTLDDGLVSAAMCLAARESASTGSFQQINVPGHASKLSQASR
jgi:predicted dehydrogenase